jgi:branched-chain amino acid transport system substrate-binding protein
MELSRRGALLVPLAAAMAGNGGAARAQAPAVRIGVLSDMSGPYRDISGPNCVVLARQAVQDFGAAARGLHVEILQADHQNKPDVGVNVARQWFDRDGVDAIWRSTTAPSPWRSTGWRGKRTRST